MPTIRKSKSQTQASRSRNGKEHDCEDLWYVRDKRIVGRKAAHDARNLACAIRRHEPIDDVPEGDLFFAMHACACQANCFDCGKSHTRAERNRWRTRWHAIRDYIVEQNMGLVYSMLSRKHAGPPDHELLSDAQLALVHAVNRFDPTKGYRFSTYACSSIAYALMYRGKQQHRQRRLFPVQHEEKMDRPVESEDSNQQLYIERMRRALRNNLAELSDVETQILDRRFPTTETTPRMTLRELGGVMGISKERVRQIQNRALRKLRDTLNEDPILQ